MKFFNVYKTSVFFFFNCTLFFNLGSAIADAQDYTPQFNVIDNSAKVQSFYENFEVTCHGLPNEVSDEGSIVGEDSFAKFRVKEKFEEALHQGQDFEIDVFLKLIQATNSVFEMGFPGFRLKDAQWSSYRTEMKELREKYFKKEEFIEEVKKGTFKITDTYSVSPMLYSVDSEKAVFLLRIQYQDRAKNYLLLNMENPNNIIVKNLSWLPNGITKHSGSSPSYAKACFLDHLNLFLIQHNTGNAGRLKAFSTRDGEFIAKIEGYHSGDLMFFVAQDKSDSNKVTLVASTQTKNNGSIDYGCGGSWDGYSLGYEQHMQYVTIDTTTMAVTDNLEELGFSVGLLNRDELQEKVLSISVENSSHAGECKLEQRRFRDQLYQQYPPNPIFDFFATTPGE